LKPPEQNVCMCSCSDTGNMQLPYNSPGGYLVQVLFSQCVSIFLLTALGGLPENLCNMSVIIQLLRSGLAWFSYLTP